MRRIQVIALVLGAVCWCVEGRGQEGVFGEVILRDGRRISGYIRQSQQILQITMGGKTETVRRSEVERIRLGGKTGDSNGNKADDTLAPDPLAEQALLHTAGAGFKLKRTKHFVVVYDGEAAVVGKLLTRLESTYAGVYRFCRLNSLPVVKPPKRLEVIFFDAYADYGRYARRVGFAHQGTHGFYHDATNRGAFFNAHHDPQFLAMQKRIRDSHADVALLESAMVGAGTGPVSVTFPDGTRHRMSKPQARVKIEEARAKLSQLRYSMDNYSKRINRMVIQHEAAHQVLFNTGVHVRWADNPPWLAEGLACLFESPPTPAGAGAGVTNQMRLYDFRVAIGGGDPRGRLDERGYDAAVKRGDLVALEELISGRVLNRGRDVNVGSLYAEAWALVHYLQRTKRKGLADYIRLVSKRRPHEAVSADRELRGFEQSLGKVNRKFERRWVRWVLAQPFKPTEAGL